MVQSNDEAVGGGGQVVAERRTLAVEDQFQRWGVLETGSATLIAVAPDVNQRFPSQATSRAEMTNEA